MEDLLEQGKRDILQDMNDNKIKTEVTSIAQEEERTGEKIAVPNAEELVARASSSLISSKKLLNDLVNQRNGAKYKINRKAMSRIIMAILDLPTGGLPVMLKSEEEKLAFTLGQKMINDRFVIIQHHISQEMKKRMKQAEQPNQGEKNEES